MPDRGFLASLFDVSFSSLVTTRVIKFLYVLSMIVIGLAALFFVLAAFDVAIHRGASTPSPASVPPVPAAPAPPMAPPPTSGPPPSPPPTS